MKTAIALGLLLLSACGTGAAYEEEAASGNDDSAFVSEDSDSAPDSQPAE